MTSFSVGDVVRLKSGGPRMTVEEVMGDDVVCTWFEKGERKQGGFTASTLTKAGAGVVRGSTRPIY